MVKSFFYLTASAQYSGCFNAAGCDSANAVSATAADDCCVNQNNGWYYMNGANCVQCVSKWLIYTLVHGAPQAYLIKYRDVLEYTY